MAEKTGRELMQEYFDVVNGDDALLSIAYDLDILPEQILAHKKGLRELMTVVDFVQHERKEAEQRGQQTERERVLALVMEFVGVRLSCGEFYIPRDSLLDAIQRGDQPKGLVVKPEVLAAIDREREAREPKQERPDGVPEFVYVEHDDDAHNPVEGGIAYDSPLGDMCYRYRFDGIVQPTEKG